MSKTLLIVDAPNINSTVASFLSVVYRQQGYIPKSYELPHYEALIAYWSRPESELIAWLMANVNPGQAESRWLACARNGGFSVITKPRSVVNGEVDFDINPSDIDEEMVARFKQTLWNEPLDRVIVVSHDGKRWRTLLMLARQLGFNVIVMGFREASEWQTVGASSNLWTFVDLRRVSGFIDAPLPEVPPIRQPIQLLDQMEQLLWPPEHSA
ncbi:NYN domain-containing protein [Patescibacteria group bacterium]|nr:MAG: NYN domain-containing protein [Patescibacteria group bacterium]